MSVGHAFQIATPEYTVTAALGIVSNTAIMKYPGLPFTWALSLIHIEMCIRDRRRAELVIAYLHLIGENALAFLRLLFVRFAPGDLNLWRHNLDRRVRVVVDRVGDHCLVLPLLDSADGCLDLPALSLIHIFAACIG